MGKGYGPEWRDFDQSKPHSQPAKARSKYGNVRTIVLGDLRLMPDDGLPLPAHALRFDSRKEAERFIELSLQQRDGKISGLQIQPRFPLHALSQSKHLVEVGCYIGDFSYVKDGAAVVEDVKSPISKTPIYEWKKKHTQIEHGIAITEV